MVTLSFDLNLTYTLTSCSRVKEFLKSESGSISAFDHKINWGLIPSSNMVENFQAKSVPGQKSPGGPRAKMPSAYSKRFRHLCTDFFLLSISKREKIFGPK